MKLDAKPSSQLLASSPPSGGGSASMRPHNSEGNVRGAVLNQNSGQSLPTSPTAQDKASSPTPLATPQPDTLASSRLTSQSEQSAATPKDTGMQTLVREYQPLVGTVSTKPIPLDIGTEGVDYAVKENTQKALVQLVVTPSPHNGSAATSRAQAPDEDAVKLPPSERSAPAAKPADASSRAPAADVGSQLASKSSLTLPVEQIRQLHQQWVEVIRVQPAPAGLSDASQPYQLELSTQQGKIQVLSNQAFTPGQRVQLAVSAAALNELQHTTQGQPATSKLPVIQLSIIQATPALSLKGEGSVQGGDPHGPPQLLNALRQYQPLKSALQVLALQQIESGRMQSLADDVRLQVTQQAQRLVQPSTLTTLKENAAALLTPSPQPATGTANTQAFAARAHAPMQTPAALLNPTQTMGANQVQAAIAQAGQQLEHHLAQLNQAANRTGSSEAGQQAGQKDNARAANPSLGMNLSRGFAHIQQNVQNGIKELLHELTGKSAKPTTPTTTAPAAALAAAPATTNPSTTGATANAAKTNAANPNAANAELLSSLKDAVRSDMKAWLMQNQLHMMQAIQSDPKGKQEQKELMDGLLKVLFNRVPGAQSTNEAEGQRILPKHLSVQPQLQKLFSGLLNQAQPDDADQQPMRQLLNLTQTLTRIQQEQVMNRQQQVQNPESPEFQMSLPYLQDKQIHWCELEFGPNSEPEKTTVTRRGWHLILRFEHAEQGAFAVEASLAGQDLSLSLWSADQTRLKQFHQHMALLKTKLQQAGFLCDHIHSKHGMPERKQRQIQQGLVDVRT